MKMKRNEPIALIVAVFVDAAQLCLFPVTVEGALSPVDVAIDVCAFGVLTSILGWNYVLLPTVLLESIPVVTEFPTWTAAVLYIIKTKAKS